MILVQFLLYPSTKQEEAEIEKPAESSQSEVEIVPTFESEKDND